MFQIKGQVQPSHLSNLQPYRLISHLRDKCQPNTFYLPDLKPNRYKSHVSRQRSSRDKFILHIYQTSNQQAKISFSRQGSFQYFHFTEYKTK